MNRSQYSDDFEEDFPNQVELYRSNVERAIRGKAGQAFLRELLASLDALPKRRLITHELVRPDGECCAIGALYLSRGLDPTGSRYSYADEVAGQLKCKFPLAAEILYLNDEWFSEATPEARWRKMRDWIVKHLSKENPS